MLISLVGLPGVGKSTIGRKLARRLNLDFVDCDALLEQRLHSSIRHFFESEGEQRFREVEANLLHELVLGRGTVIATGGGVVLRPDNREMLRSRTFCVYLRAETDALLHRLRRDIKRPLFQGADPATRLRELSTQREPLYLEAASVVIETRGLSSEQLVGEISRRASASAGPAGDAPR